MQRADSLCFCALTGRVVRYSIHQTTTHQRQTTAFPYALVQAAWLPAQETETARHEISAVTSTCWERCGCGPVVCLCDIFLLLH